MCVPLLLIAIILPCWFFLFRFDSLKTCIDKDRKETAMALMKWVYKEGDDQYATLDEIYDHLRQ